MKKWTLFLLAGCITLCMQAQQFTQAQLQATGLTCALCSNAINKALLQLPFVSTVKSDIKTSSFAIVFKEGNTVDFDEIKQAVEDAGFSVGKLSVTGKFEAVEVESDTHVRVGTYNFHFVNTQKETLSGERTLILADKGFVSAKDFKKWSARSKHACVQSGRSADCCSIAGISPGERVYHVTL